MVRVTEEMYTLSEYMDKGKGKKYSAHLAEGSADHDRTGAGICSEPAVRVQSRSLNIWMP